MVLPFCNFLVLLPFLVLPQILVPPAIFCVSGNIFAPPAIFWRLRQFLYRGYYAQCLLGSEFWVTLIIYCLYIHEWNTAVFLKFSSLVGFLWNVSLCISYTIFPQYFSNIERKVCCTILSLEVKLDNIFLEKLIPLIANQNFVILSAPCVIS